LVDSECFQNPGARTLGVCWEYASHATFAKGILQKNGQSAGGSGLFRGGVCLSSKGQVCAIG
jgi:hypothetical protein